MFQFPGFALLTLCVQVKSTWFSRRSSDVVLRRHRVRGSTGHLIIEDCQVGFPIRTSRDQRVLSPPPGLSQSATSFIASCCQGIHQTPLSRLIRSRRRQALLRGGGSSANPSIISLVGSLDPSASPRQETRRSRVLNDPRGIRQNPRSVSFDLERLLSLQRTSKGPLRGARPTRRTPEQRLVYNSLHDVSILSSRSRDRTGRLIVG